MTKLFIAAAVVSSLSIGTVCAEEAEEPHVNTLFTGIPGVISEASIQNTPSTAEQGVAVQAASSNTVTQ